MIGRQLSGVINQPPSFTNTLVSASFRSIRTVRLTVDNSDQQLTKPAAKSSLATWGCSWARPAQVRRAGEGDSLSSSTLKWRIHSAQSSRVLRWLDSHARRRAPSFTCPQQKRVRQRQRSGRRDSPTRCQGHRALVTPRAFLSAVYSRGTSLLLNHAMKLILIS
jgi:hypothetical protein